MVLWYVSQFQTNTLMKLNNEIQENKNNILQDKFDELANDNKQLHEKLK